VLRFLYIPAYPAWERGHQSAPQCLPCSKAGRLHQPPSPAKAGERYVSGQATGDGKISSTLPLRPVIGFQHICRCGTYREPTRYLRGEHLL
jgi:hypothetical protein